MRALIIGGNGFIGSHLVDRLCAEGDAVSVLDPGPVRADVDWRDVRHLQGAYTDAAMLESALAECDIVFHLASTTVPSTSNADPARDVSTNLIGTLGLLDAMRARGLRRIVFLSSGGTVYGNPERLPIPESHPLRPISSYGIVKVAIEQYLHMYRHLGELDPLVLRPSNPYGPRQSGSRVQGFVAAALASAHTGQPLTIWGDGRVVRDFIYIEDAVDAVVRAVNAGCTGLYNLGSGGGHSLNEVCAAVEQATGRRLNIDHLPARGFDVAEVVLDNSRLRADTGWQPARSLAEGISATWAFLRSRDPG